MGAEIDSRVWTLLKTGGKHPGCRWGHTMWSWGNALYVWGSRVSRCSKLMDTKLYRLDLSKTDLMWEVVKTNANPPGREYHAGVLCKDKYCISGGCFPQYDLHITKECWVLNMANYKINPTSQVLPKAQSFGAAIKTTDNSLQLLVGGGYGFTGESMQDKEQYNGIDRMKPLSTNEGESSFSSSR